MGSAAALVSPARPRTRVVAELSVLRDLAYEGLMWLTEQTPVSAAPECGLGFCGTDGG
jgi:hypothetical protein